jgi:CarboxypepD_reg-like domain
MKAFLLIFILSCATYTNAQFGKVSGKVSFEKSADFSSATIYVLKSRTGATTDSNGYFNLSLPVGKYKLQVMAIGYESKFVNVNIIQDSVFYCQVRFEDPCLKYAKGKLDNTCPVCKLKDKVIPIKYGYPLGKMDTKKYYYAGCEVTNCDPTWYCKRDKHKF